MFFRFLLLNLRLNSYIHLIKTNIYENQTNFLYNGNVIVFLLLITSTTVSYAQNQLLRIGSGQLQNETVLVQQNDNATTIRFELNEMELMEVATGYGKAFISASTKAPLMLEEGAPELFYLTSTFIIPDTGDSQLEITYGSFTDFENIEIAPSKGNLSRSVDPQTVPFIISDNCGYSEREYQPFTVTSSKYLITPNPVNGILSFTNLYSGSSCFQGTVKIYSIPAGALVRTGNCDFCASFSISMASLPMVCI